MPENQDEVHNGASVVSIQYHSGVYRNKGTLGYPIYNTCNDEVPNPKRNHHIGSPNSYNLWVSQLEERHIRPEEQPKEKMTGKDDNAVKEEVMINPAFPNQTVIIATQFSSACRRQLINLLKDNQYVFVWRPSDMVGSRDESCNTL